MQLRVIRFFVRETLLNIKRNRHSVFTMLGQTVVSLLILGICLIIILNANNFVTEFFNSLEINVYLLDDIDDLTLTQLQRHARSMDGTGEIQYISKDEAYQWMKENSPFQLDEIVRFNPFPASLKIKVQSANQIEPIAKEISGMSGVESVDYASESLGRILPVFYFIQASCFFLAIILAGMTLFSIINSIKLAIHARRQEIRIMRLVGATDKFIRWPFLMEGMFYGLVGSLIAFILVSGSYAIIMGFKGSSNLLLSFLVGTGTIMLNLAVLMIVIGILVGVMGSHISVEKHLTSVVR